MGNENLYIAKQESRIINAVLDSIAWFALWFLLSLGVVYVGFDQVHIDESGEQTLIAPMILLIPAFWSYYILTEYLFQKTLGKLVTRTRVVTKSGSKPTFGQIVGRTLSRSIPFEYFSYLFSATGIHDRLSGTRVIKE